MLIRAIHRLREGVSFLNDVLRSSVFRCFTASGVVDALAAVVVRGLYLSQTLVLHATILHGDDPWYRHLAVVALDQFLAWRGRGHRLITPS